MSLRIACDLDGTLVDMDSALQREAERLFGADVDVRLSPSDLIQPGHTAAPRRETVAASKGPSSPNEQPQKRPLTRAETRRLWEEVRAVENFWTRLPEIEPGAVARFASLAGAYGWEVLFLTQRPSSEGATAQVQSQQWLRTHGFELPSVFVMNGSRGRVADVFALNVVIDDRPDNALDIATDSNAVPLLVWRHSAGALPPALKRMHLHVVSTFAGALAYLERITAEPPARQRPARRASTPIGF